ncbi:MAG: spermidine/putrescine ABC transporter substrate-binding protein [Acidimicrobiales bacterium]|jgi:spermidine/putrescine transport system substrate-binding protein
MSRRDFMRMAAGGAALAGVGGSLLGACQRPGDSNISIPLPRKNSPVRWPVFADNEPIKSGLPHEDGVLQIYNWVAYINQAVVDGFAKKYHVPTPQVTTFNTMSEAIAKLQTGELDFDIFFPTIDVLGPLVEGKLLRPLNHSYVPNISQAWPDFLNPFYDLDWRYTVPYTIYTTGMSWRKDLVDEDPYTMANPWAMPWNEKYRGKVAILDDYREGICLGLLKQGIYDLNTTDVSQINSSYNELQNLSDLVDVQIDNNDYSEIPSGQTWIHHAWSGDMAAAWEYLPAHESADVIGYWFPPDGRGPVANDMITILNSGHNPVLAHLFLDYMLDLPVALTNIGFNGYMQPIEGVTAEKLVELQYLPKALESTVVLPENFRTGIEELGLPPAANDAWEQAWLQFGGGL